MKKDSMKLYGNVPLICRLIVEGESKHFSYQTYEGNECTFIARHTNQKGKPIIGTYKYQDHADNMATRIAAKKRKKHQIII